MVAKSEVIISPLVIDYLDKLVKILYEKNYFGFITSAENYVSNIYDFIENNIALSQQHNTPKALNHLGSYYFPYNPNRRTTWYIFFEKKGNNFLVTHILNNHTEASKFL